jgi:hypothetical protein
MTTRADYVRHAERHDTELFLESAARLVAPVRPDLSVRELGYLSLRLQQIDEKWRLPKREDGAFEIRGLEGAGFALLLVGEGVAERDACRMAMVSWRTVQRRQRPAREVLEQLALTADSGPEAAFQSGEIATNRGPEADGLPGPNLVLSGPHIAVVAGGGR